MDYGRPLRTHPSKSRSSMSMYPVFLIFILSAIVYVAYVTYTRDQQYEKAMRQRQAEEIQLALNGKHGGINGYYERKRSALKKHGIKIEVKKDRVPCFPSGYPRLNAGVIMKKDKNFQHLYRKHFINQHGNLSMQAGREFGMILSKYCESKVCIFDDYYFKYGHNLELYKLFYCSLPSKKV